MKVYIERKYIQVQLIPFSNKISTLLTLESLNIYDVGLISIRDVSPPFISAAMEYERVIIKLGLKLVQAVRKENRSKGQFGSLFLIPYITLLIDLRPRVNERLVTCTSLLLILPRLCVCVCRCVSVCKI